MIIDIVDGITTLKPSDGFKYVSNGEVWSEEVYLGKNDAVENWHDTNTEPPEPEEEIPAEEALDIIRGVST